ncbi:hypothetical protein MC885_005973, partial [Smutsia gigantea]
LLQAASSEKEESSRTESELTCCLSELYQRKSREESTVSHQEDSRKKRGVPRTPVRQKMNTMCRSLKMLNVARLNVKAQKSNPDAAGERGIQKTAGRRTADKSENRGRTLRSSKPKDFKTEEELLSYVHENYQKTVATGEIMLHSCARNMISTIKAFLKSRGTKELEMNCLNQVKNNLLKTSKNLRQNLGKTLDKEDNVRECQLQVFLRLEMCLQCPSIHESTDNTEQVTDWLRMICLTEDSAYLAKFLEEILGLYINSIPKTLGNLYNSLGFVIPQKLAGVLPTDFFSDDSLTQDSKSPLLSVPLMSSAHKSVSGVTESDQLEELRTRSAKKRRKNALIRHKSIAEVSQNLRQIEIPKVSKRATKTEHSCPALQQPALPVKDTVQEVTKVRRNLFNQEMISPSKRSVKRGFPRSHSVSAVEGLECKLDNLKRPKGYHKLLTKSVAETPIHKQISRRLLHKQIKGRSSDPGPDIDVVEESPEKREDEINLRRSPRIKQLSLSRTSSGSFYSASQPKSRSVQRAHSLQQDKSGQRDNSPIQSICSPKRLLFGAVTEMISPAEKGSTQIKRPSGNTVGSEIPRASQTPKKRSWKSPSSSKATPRRFPQPQTPLCTPERLQKSPAEVTPAKQIFSKESLTEDSSHGWDSPSQPKVTLEKGHSPAGGGASPFEKKIPGTPKRPCGQPCELLQNSTWPPPVNSSSESTSCLAAPILSAAQARSEHLAAVRYSLRTPPRAAALGVQRETAYTDTPPNQNHQCPHPCGRSPTEKPAQKQKDKAVKTPKRPRVMMTSQKKPFTPPLCRISQRSAFRKCSVESPPPGELDWKEPQKSSSMATSLPGSAPSSPPNIPQIAPSNTASLLPPSKIGKKHRKTSDPGTNLLECQPYASAAPRTAVIDNPAAITDTGRDQKEVTRSPQSSPEGHSYPGTGFGRAWHLSSPLLIPSDTEYLTLLDEAEPQGSENLQSDVSPLEEGEERSRMAVADEDSSLSNPRSPPSPPSGPSFPLTPSYDLRCTADRRQRQVAARLGNLHAPAWLPKVPASPQAYEVELEMPASGLPKLRIKKVDPSSLSKAEPLRREESPLPGPSLPRGSKATSKPETHVSPPCLRPSHSTPGKNGGQTYICQSWTPTRCPPSTPSPFKTDIGVPWTPSPKHSGKTTPDRIKDWPRRKRAAGCSLSTAAGRSEASTEPPAGGPPETEGKGQSLGLGFSKTPVLGDFELEGVCQLPDQSPPRDSGPKAEEAISWGQFGLGRKRLLSATEEAVCQSNRVCDKQREDSEGGKSEERSPSASAPGLSSGGDDEVFVSGSPPAPGWAVRTRLSASGLQALTQSPMLFRGKTPPRGKDNRDEDTDAFPPTAEESPFSRAFSRRRPISRTYTRKKLISQLGQNWLGDF